MARITGPVCRLCRRDGMKLFLKGTRCDTPKCAIERRDTAAGHAPVSPRQAHRLRPALARKAEGEALLRRAGAAVPQLFRRATRRKGNTGETLMSLLERRWTTSCIAWASARAAPRPGNWSPRPHHRQRPPRGHSQLPGAAGRCDPREEPRKSLQVVQANLAEHRRSSRLSCRWSKGPSPKGACAPARGLRHFDSGADPIDHRVVLEVDRRAQLQRH